MDLVKYNQAAWDQQVANKNRWTVPVTSEVIHAARRGDWTVVLTPQKRVPASWFPNLQGLDVLCLASGGGQQAPILAAAGANITSFDHSQRQIDQDQLVAKRDGLEIKTEQGDMRDLSRFDNHSFDLIFNPCSVAFIQDVRPVFSEAYRVLRPGGSLMAGFINPLYFLFDGTKLQKGELVVRHKLPYADTTHLDSIELKQLRDKMEPLIFSHSLEEMIAGQLGEGFKLEGMLEDVAGDDVLSNFIPGYFATLACKPFKRIDRATNNEVQSGK